mgnify:CR=1 FL=1
MLKFLLVIALSVLCLLAYSQNQSGNTDILYLKNGKVVEGKIIKQEMGTISIKVFDAQTSNYVTRIYQQGEVKKIEKAANAQPQQATEGNITSQNVTAGQGLGAKTTQEQLITDNNRDAITSIQTPTMQSYAPLPDTQQQVVTIDGTRTGNPDDYFDPFSVPLPKRRERLWNREIRGFRVFIDYAYIHGIGKNKNNRFEWATSIGFQFNPIFYVGVGTAYDLTLNNKDSSLPVFINPRINFLDENTTPFWDVKVGYSVMDGKGFYCSTSVGVSFAKHGKSAWNLGLVYSIQNSKYYNWSNTDPQVWTKYKPVYHGIALKLTYEFGIGR